MPKRYERTVNKKVKTSCRLPSAGQPFCLVSSPPGAQGSARADDSIVGKLESGGFNLRRGRPNAT